MNYLNMFRFEHTEYLILLLLLPVMAAVFIVVSYIKRRKLKKIGDPLLVRELMPDVSFLRYNIKFFLFSAAVAFLILAIAGPQFGTRLTDVNRSDAEVIIALDVSNSMRAEDIKPSRLEKAKLDLSRLMDRLSDTRAGLIVFAGNAYTQVPITGDILTAKTLLSGVSTEMISRQGTNIGDAIELAINSFSQEQTGKALIIVSDGEDHEGNVKQACDKAREKGIVIYTAGIGQVQGTRVPSETSQFNRDFIRDNDGNFVVTRLNEQMLADIASLGGGRYFGASPQGLMINEIAGELDKLKSGEQKTTTYEEYAEQFPVLAFAAFVILFLEIFIFERKKHWLSKLKLNKI